METAIQIEIIAKMFAFHYTVMLVGWYKSESSPPQQWEKIEGQTVICSVVQATDLEEGEFWIQTSRKN